MIGRSLQVMGGVVTTMVLAACYGPAGEDWKDTGPSTDSGVPLDLDADGYTSDVDCDDGDADIHPDANEACSDMIDNDCDGLIDADDDECASAS